MALDIEARNKVSKIKKLLVRSTAESMAVTDDELGYRLSYHWGEAVRAIGEPETLSQAKANLRRALKEVQTALTLWDETRRAEGRAGNRRLERREA